MKNNKKKKIALVGNPNCGKTTLFNMLTGSKQKIGNWSGVTVEKKVGFLNLKGQELEIIDLPGIYSFSAHSEDEIVARDFIIKEKPDLIINIIDSLNLERSLYLTLQLLEMGLPLLIVLNRKDLVQKRNIFIEQKHLAQHLSSPVLGICAFSNDDLKSLKETIWQQTVNPPFSKIKIPYLNEIEEVILNWDEKLSKVANQLGFNTRWLSVKVLEGDNFLTKEVLASESLPEEEIKNKRGQIKTLLNESTDIVVANCRYGFINGLVRDVISKKSNKREISDKIDSVVLNRFLGLPIFFLIMYVVFWLTITFGGAFIDFFDQFFGAVFVDGFGKLLGFFKSPAWLVAILAGGVGAGLQTVSTFIPIIFMMFFILSFLEDSGYMARAAFVMDKFMTKIGLPGKSFVPLLLGFGCSVPAIMATRTLDSKRDKLLTIFLIPFMSCGAKLPVYALFGAAFFPYDSGLVVFSLYLVGIVMAIFSGFLLKKTIFKGDPSHLVMELPVYNPPRLKHIFFHTTMRLKQFITKAGKIIIIAVFILSFLNSVSLDGSFGNENKEKSVLSQIGKILTPVFSPLGIKEDNWPATVSIISGLMAKEAVVGTLNSLYQQNKNAKGLDDEADSKISLKIKEAFKSIPANLKDVWLNSFNLEVPEEVVSSNQAKKRLYSLMQNHFSEGKAQAYAFLLFILLYFPCLASFGVIIREIGLKLSLFLALYLTSTAWIIATLFYQVSLVL